MGDLVGGGIFRQLIWGFVVVIPRKFSDFTSDRESSVDEASDAFPWCNYNKVVNF
jgi:hypothetical protein